MPPMGTNLASEFGSVTDRLIDYYVERAKGGVGLIIVENTAVDWPGGKAIPLSLRIAEIINRFVAAGVQQFTLRLTAWDQRSQLRGVIHELMPRLAR